MKPYKIVLFTVLLFILILGFYFAYENCLDIPLKLSRVRKILIYTDLQNPQNYKQPVDLVVYFHGAGCDETLMRQPYSLGGLDFSNSGNLYRKDIIFASFGYDDSMHWTSPRIVKDTIRVIRYISKQFKIRKIVFIGVSMGGSLALDVLSQADKELKALILGVISVFPIIDYEYTLSHTQQSGLKKHLNDHFVRYKNSVKEMKASSPITYISGIPVATEIILVEGIQDTHVCSNQIESYFERIKNLNEKNKLLKWDVDHRLASVQDDYKKLVVDFLK